MLKLYGILAIYSPLVGFLISGIINKSLSDRFSQLITCIFMVLALFSSCVLVELVINQGLFDTYLLYTWFKVDKFIVNWGMKLDTLSVLMIITINTVSLLVHIYSIGYMSHDNSIPRFMSYLSLFTWTMLILVSSSNLLQLFFGWEGVGLASYLLIGFWYQKPSACYASMKAFVVNRIGDIGLVLGISGIFLLFQTVEFEELFNILNSGNTISTKLLFWSYDIDALTILGLLLFLGAMGKSAQLGLHIWLPDAMEGPTPVSALIHAATMVTAGVFLVCRLSPLYELAPMAREFICIIGSLTAFFAATVALTQTDIKRIIAYSTCSQLGYMFFSASVSAYSAAMFHLVTHAFFKALLFLGAGSVIHALSGEQDIRNMGGIWRKIPITYAMMWIGSLAIAGVPFFSGYYSKHAILESAFVSPLNFSKISFILGVLVSGLTAFYSWRLLIIVFHGNCRASENVKLHIHESPISMQFPMVVLSIGAIIIGFTTVGGFLGSELDHYLGFWGNSLTVIDNPIHKIHELPLWLSISLVIVPITGIIFAYYIYDVFVKNNNTNQKFSSPFINEIHKFFVNKWYFDEFFEKIFIKPTLALGNIFWKRSDIGLIDKFGPDGVATISLKAAKILSRLQSGYVYHYTFVMIIGLAIMTTWLVSRFF